MIVYGSNRILKETRRYARYDKLQDAIDHAKKLTRIRPELMIWLGENNTVKLGIKGIRYR